MYDDMELYEDFFYEMSNPLGKRDHQNDDEAPSVLFNTASSTRDR